MEISNEEYAKFIKDIEKWKQGFWLLAGTCILILVIWSAGIFFVLNQYKQLQADSEARIVKLNKDWNDTLISVIKRTQKATVNNVLKTIRENNGKQDQPHITWQNDDNAKQKEIEDTHIIPTDH